MIKRKYEIIFILEAIDYAKIKEEVKTLLENNKCEIEKEEDLGIKTLGYPIKKQHKGFYYLLYIIAQPNSLKELNHDIGLNESILKYMCLVYNEKKIKANQYRRTTKPTPKYEQHKKENNKNEDKNENKNEDTSKDKNYKETEDITIDKKE